MRTIMFRFLFTSSVVMMIAAVADAQEIEIDAPEGWRGETIKLPAPFAPEMKLKGIEEIRFAPGMFEKDEEDFFSYIFVFQVEESQSLNQTVLESELLAYYQGLCKTVLEDDADDVDFDEFKIEIESVKSDAKEKSSPPVSYSAKLEWIEPFVTKQAQTLNLEIDVWQDAKSKQQMMFASVSPSKSDSEIWNQMREIRDKVIAESLNEE